MLVNIHSANVKKIFGFQRDDIKFCSDDDLWKNGKSYIVWIQNTCKEDNATF